MEVSKYKGYVYNILGMLTIAGILQMLGEMAENGVYGIIDLVIEDEKELTLIDWKSDIIADDARKSELKAHYGKQMDYYVKALETELPKRSITGNCVFLFAPQ